MHAHGRAVGDGNGGAGLASFGESLDRTVLARGVVLADESDSNARADAEHARPERAKGAVFDALECERHAPELRVDADADDAESGADPGAGHQGRLRVALGEHLDVPDADNGCEDTDGGDHERESGHVAWPTSRNNQSCDRKACDNGLDIGFEEVSAQPGHVTDVVAHVIGDNGGVARVIFGDACLDFAHEVRAHVGAFRENAAA